VLWQRRHEGGNQLRSENQRTGAIDLKVLVIEDDPQAQSFLSKGLIAEGHGVDAVANGLDGLELAQTRAYDAAIIDRMLPGLDGLSLVKQLRKDGRDVRIIFLTALGGIDDRVNGLDAGADDYLTKPFAFSELLARLNALARRPSGQLEERVLRVADLELDVKLRTVTRAGRQIDIQAREFKLLEYLMSNTGRVLTRNMLLERVWDFNFDPKTSVVETHISRLRAKIDKPFKKQLIQTLRGSGYRMNGD
jgi:two-component system, OmpR family, response regulator